MDQKTIEEANKQRNENRANWPGNKKWELLNVPRDEEGFVKAFATTEVDEYMRFFDDFGFVVIKNVLSKDEVEETIAEIWSELEGKHKQIPTGIDRNDPTTWTDYKWPQPTVLGLLGVEPTKGKMAWQNRQNQNIYSIFSNLMRRPDLWVSVDRYGSMRPTKSVPKTKMEDTVIRVDVQSNSQDTADHPEWKSMAIWTHWDLNPWAWELDHSRGNIYKFTDFIQENNGSKWDGQLKLQGLVALTDSRSEDGGFCCVPGFWKHLHEWASLTKDSEHARNAGLALVGVPPEDDLHMSLQRITSRAGIWRGEEPHCNYPNDSNRFRFNQYIKMIPAQEGKDGTDLRQQQLKSMIPSSFQVTELGNKLFGLKPWN